MLATSFERYMRHGDPSPTPTSLSQARSFLNTDDTLSRKNSNQNLHSKINNIISPQFFNNTNFLHSFTKTFETVISYQQSLTHIVLDITRLLEKIPVSSSSNNQTSTPKTINKRLSAQSYLENQSSTPSNNQLKGEITALTTSLKKLLEQIPCIQKEASYNLDKSSYTVPQSKFQSPKAVSPTQSQTPKKRLPSSSSTTNLSTKPNRSITSAKKMESAKKSRIQLNRENSQDHSTNSRLTASSSVKGRDQYKRFPFFVNNSNSKENSNHRSGLQKKHSRNYTLQEILNKQDLVINLLEDKTEFEAESRLLQTLQSDFEENKDKVQIKDITKNTRKSLLMVQKKEVEEEEENHSQTLSMENYSSVKQILGDYDFPINELSTEERLQERSIIKEMIRKEEEYKDSRPYSGKIERMGHFLM